jgi:AraC-like DNA-binding protein
MPQATLFFALEALALAHQNHIHHLVGQHMGGYDMYLSMPAPAHIHNYELLSPVRFHFDAAAQPGLRVLMPPAMLELPLALGDEEVMREIDARCSALGQRPTRGEVSWTEYVNMVLRDTHCARITMEDIAQRAQVSARTLDRNLKKEGMGFRELSEKVRFERACEMLSAPDITAAEVARQLGFSDAPNFNRAFRRVVGVTPGEFQEGKARKRQ